MLLAKKLVKSLPKINYQLYATAPAGAATKGAGGLGGKLSGASNFQKKAQKITAKVTIMSRHRYSVTMTHRRPLVGNVDITFRNVGS